MNTMKKDTRWMVTVALMMAVVILLANTPLGLIQLPIIKATTIHIPVIVGAVVLGPLAGGILGAVFGICSMINNTLSPALLSFAFSPFLSTTGIPGAIKKRLRTNQNIALAAVGFVSSMFHTIIVMGSIYVLLAAQYAQAREVAEGAVFGLIMGTVAASGVPEAIAAAILVFALGKVLLKIYKTK